MSEQVQDQEQPSLSEAMETLTGFDEIAIEKAFGSDIVRLLNEKATMASRALLFVRLKHRDGLNDQEARKAVMQMPLGSVRAQFSIDEDEDGDIEPVTESGKGDEQPG